MSPTLRDFDFRLDVGFQVQELRLGDHVLATADERRKLLEQVRAGEHVELDVTAVTYIQRETPNRSYVRFKASALRSIAKSGIGAPFLTDHRQHDVLARGGTCIASKAEKNSAGEWQFVQTFRLVKPWAVEGVLDGTIDRFSIGWHPTGPIVYSHTKETIEDFPRHWPGDEVEVNGKTVVVEWEFTAAELVETSAVNVPAVVGTTIEGFRAALAAHLGAPPRPKPQDPEKETSMHRLLQALGLSADAAEESALAAVEKLEQDKTAATERAEAAELELKSERELHERTKEQLATYEAREEAEKKAKLDAEIETLYQEGKLLRSGTDRAADPYEETLREIHDKLGLERFRAAAAKLTSKVPTGRQSGDKDPTPREGGDQKVVILSERHRQMIKDIGMTEEEYAANMQKGGQL